MSSHDVQLTELLEPVNIRNKVPQLPSFGRTGIYRNALKRALDVMLILLSLPVIVPIIAMIACFIMLNGGTPFYIQKRIGRNGKTFRLWKFRTMVHNADDVLEDYLTKNPLLRMQWDTKQKLLKDPRITPIGHFLRKSSIDELPQLWNVLRGDMALVGPRPMMVDQKPLYHGTDYYELRPGITGLWQISDRNNASFADRVDFDARYNANLTFSSDVRILWCTFGVVVRGTGC